MTENKEWVVQGYQFSSQKDATQAKGELLKIQKLEEKMDYKNPQMVYMVYNKALENRIFKTPIGYEYLKKLQTVLEKSPQIQEPIKEIPIYQMYNLRDSTNPVVERIKNDPKLQQKRERERKRKEFFPIRTSIFFNVLLAILVIVMLYISTTGSNPNVLNYERSLQDKYAVWEQELSEREAVIREKERELLLAE